MKPLLAHLEAYYAMNQDLPPEHTF